MQVHSPLGGISQRWLTEELAIINNFQPVVELGGERDPLCINILAVQIPPNGGQGDFDLYAMYSDVIWWCLVGGGIPPIYLLSESSHVKGVKLSYKLLTIAA